MGVNDSGGGAPTGCTDPDGDTIYEDGQDADNYCVTTKFRDILAQPGYLFDVDLFHWCEPDALHNEAAWADRFIRATTACESAGWVAP